MAELRIMEFCPKCGSRLEPKKSKTGKEASLVLVCPKCGYKKQESDKKVEQKVGKVIQHTPQQFVAVIGKEEQKLRTLPTVRIECPKCGNNVAYVWHVRPEVLTKVQLSFCVAQNVITHSESIVESVFLYCKRQFMLNALQFLTKSQNQ